MLYFEDFALISSFGLSIVQGWFVLAKNLWFTEWKWSLILIPTYLIGFILLIAFIKCMIEMLKELHEWEHKENQ
jgi:hypothetical protein